MLIRLRDSLKAKSQHLCMYNGIDLAQVVYGVSDRSYKTTHNQQEAAMETIRARRISESFSRIRAFTVENTPRGICVHYQGNLAYFIREACFWPFAFNLGRANHEEGQIAEIEAELTA